MVAFVFVVVVLLAVGLVGATVEGLLWLTAISVLLILVAIAYVSRRFRTSEGS